MILDFGQCNLIIHLHVQKMQLKDKQCRAWSCMYELGFYVPFNSISVLSGWWKGEYERLCAMKHCLGSERISPLAGFDPVNPWSEV